MTPECAAVVSSWIAKAHSDLASGRILIQGPEPHLDTGSYHCQQAAEKALKGFLTAKGIEARKTHDLLDLLNSCIESDASFDTLRDDARLLVPLATQFRYPGDHFEPLMVEALEALECATRVTAFVKDRI